MAAKAHWMAAGLMALAGAASAQTAPANAPFQLQNPQGSITTPQGRAASDTMLSTKPAAPGALPWQQPAPVQVTPPGAQARPQPIPFGRSTASQYEPIPEGPRGVMAVPVENVEMIEASEPAPAIAAPPEADPVNEDPAAPTELTAPIFKGGEAALAARLTVLNKVTARAQEVEIASGQTARVGKLSITASQCQQSAEGSLPDAAVLLGIEEILPEEEAPKKLFSGWIYQSSPSVSSLEHPVYDVTLLGCKGAAPVKADAKKP